MEQIVNQLEKFDLISKEPSDFRKKLVTMRQEPPVYRTTFAKGTIPMTLTFNDILMVPQYGEIESRYLIYHLDRSASWPPNSPTISLSTSPSYLHLWTPWPKRQWRSKWPDRVDWVCCIVSCRFRSNVTRLRRWSDLVSLWTPTLSALNRLPTTRRFGSWSRSTAFHPFW